MIDKSDPEEGTEENSVSVEEAYVTPDEKILDPERLDADSLTRLPKPTGWRLLILPYRGKGKTESGVIIPDAVIDRESVATVCGYVLKAGPLAYKDTEKFPEGPWCNEKDWVIFGRYAGSRFKIEGGEVRILNDDEVLATISSPDDILHI